MRVPERDDICAYCEFEGRNTVAFAYRMGYGLTFWCPWHQKDVPSLSRTRPQDRIPVGAQRFTEWRYAG